MLADTDSFHQEFEIATQHLAALRRQLDLLPDRQDAPKPALEGLAAALLALKQAYGDLFRQEEACAARCRDIEAERAYYRDVFEHAPHARLLTDLSGTIQLANAPVSILFQASQDALAGQPLAAFVPEGACEALSEHLAQLQAGGVVRGWEVCLQPASGDAVTVSVDAVPVHDLEHRLVGLQWLLRDISRQVQAEEALRQSESKYRMLVDSLHDGVWLLDKDDRTTFANPRMAEMLGCTVDEMLGCHLLTFVGEEQLDLARARMARRRQGIKEAVDFEFRRKDGTPLYANIEVTPLFDDRGQYAGALAGIADMTAHRRADEERERLLAQATRDRQRAEELAATLQRERDTLQTVMESTRAQVAYLDPNFNFVSINTAYAEGSRHAKEELLGRNHFDLFPNPENQGIFERVRDTGQPAWYHAKPFEFADQPERGVTYWDWSLVPVKSSTGQVEGLVLSLLDVTCQVRDGQYLDSLRAEAQRQADEMEAVFAALVDPVIVYDAAGAILRANPAAVESLGLDPVGLPLAVVGQNVKVRYPDGRPIPADELVAARALRGETVRGVAELMLGAGGDQLAIVASGAPIVTGGQVSGAVVAWHDITELREAEAALRQVNERLELTQAASDAGSWDWDIPSGRLEWSPKMFELFGLDMRTTVASFDAWRSVLHPEDREVAEKRINLALETQSDLASEYRIIQPDGRLRWISALGRGQYDEQGQPSRMTGLCLDITDRKLAEAKVEHLSSFPQLNPNPVLEIDASGTIVFHNAATTEAIRRLGLEDGASAFLPDDLPVILRELNQKKESAFQREVQVGGATFSETVQVIPAFDVVRIYAFEITKRKKAEEALRRSEERFRLALKHAPVTVAAQDRDLRFVWAYNQRTVPPSEVIGKTDTDLFPPETAGRLLTLKRQVLETGAEVADRMWVSSGGQQVYVDLYLEPIRNEAGEIEGVGVATVNLTERKRAEDALRSAQLQAEEEKRHLEAVLQALPIGVVITDAQGGVLLTNGMDAQIWGGRPITHDVDDYVQYKAWWADSGKPVEPHEWASAQAVEKGESVFGQVLEIQRFDGEHRFVLNSAVPIHDEGGQVIGSAVAIQDITELRRAEQALRESEERFRTVVENSRDGINMLDLQTGRYIFMSPAQVALTGFSAEELRDLSAEEAYERVHPDDREKSISQQKEIAAGQKHGSTVEYRWRVKSGEYRWFSDSRKVVRDQQGRAVALVGVSRDITDQKRADEALHASEEKFGAAFRVSPTGLVIARARDGTVLDVNEAFSRALGYERSELVGARVADLNLVPPGDARNRLPQLVRQEGPVIDHELEFRTKGGEVATMLVSFASIRIRDEDCILGVARDITLRKRVEEALRRTEAELALVSRGRAITEERQRLARELHDSVSQALYGISLGVNTALTLLDVDRNKVLEALNYSLSQTQAALAEMRALIFALRPEALAAEGVVAALSKETAAVTARSNIEIEMSLCDEPDVSIEVKEALYRIAQEALQNAIKHARCSRIYLRLTCQRDGLILEVCDNGAGFDPLASYPGHLGLRSMRERATSVGGKLEIASAPGRGTQIRAHIPISAGQTAGSG